MQYKEACYSCIERLVHILGNCTHDVVTIEHEVCIDFLFLMLSNEEGKLVH